MTAITVTVLLLIIGGFIAFAIVLQLKEQARLAKMRKISKLNNQLRQVRRYLDDLPPQYQPKDMRLWLFSRTIAICDELIALQPDDNIKRRRRQLAQEMSEFQKSKQKRRAKPMSDEVMIVEVKRVFESFRTFLISAKRDKLISDDIMRRYNDLFDFYDHKISADHFAYLARQAFLSGKIEKAGELYRDAIGQLAPIKDSVEAKTIISKYEDLLKEIEEDLAMQRLEAQAVREDTDAENEKELNDEWSKFIDDNTFTEKKRF